MIIELVFEEIALLPTPENQAERAKFQKVQSIIPPSLTPSDAQSSLVICVRHEIRTYLCLRCFRRKAPPLGLVSQSGAQAGSVS